jgi:hypothetical protein
MTRDPAIRRLLRRAIGDEGGGVLVELAMVLPVFLLLMFGLIDFGRMGYEYVMASKATDVAARLAVARPPACPGVVERNERGSTGALPVPPRFGTACGSTAGVCATPATVTCLASLDNPTVAEIWGRIEALMPGYATPANLRFSYSADQNLGFLGGPYVPVVTVEVVDLDFRFASPLGAMSTFAGGNWAGFSPTIPFPAMSSSLPGEDLALGEAG